jgi:ABC-2 type transport system ATP-binding protein
MAATTVADFAGVSKSFGDTHALDDVTLAVPPGDSLGLLGPNGAGKTTLIALLTGLRRPDAGTVRLFGGSPLDPVCRAGLGVTPQATGVPTTLRVREVFDFVAAHFRDPVAVDALMEEYGLVGLAGKQTGALSGGQQRRLLVALALVGRPKLVVLDEPTTGLDVEARDTLWAGLRRYRDDGGTLVVTSHYLGEIEALATRVVVLDHGAVIADGSVDSIRNRVQLTRVSVRTPEPEHVLAALPGVVSVDRAGPAEDQVTVLATRDSDALIRALVQQDIAFRRLEVRGASLEEAFLLLTGHSGEAAAASASQPADHPAYL